MEFATVENAWVNTIDSKAPGVVEKACSILKSNLYCTLSTCSTDGYPWVTPVFFVYDDRLTLY
jgi:nitroimidazol reductase NimA-like FMN-containing flavoprotein (pyridoxamine 5'-phosphate oxidase superfamily)